jgi:hypothetical protein
MVAIAVALTPGAALAQSCKAPPGMSAIDQYCEAIPGPVGDRGSGDADRGGRPIPASARAALERQGAEGRAILALSAAGTARETGARGGGSAPGPDSSGEHVQSPASNSGNPLSALASGVSDGATANGLLGTVMLAVALVFFASVWLRYRRRAPN